jgi:hypothetical protein
MFLDETEGVTNKARKASANASTRANSLTPLSKSQPPAELKKSLSAGDPPRTLSPDVEARASAFFFEHFSLDPTLALKYQLKVSTAVDNSAGVNAFIHSIRAMGLAGLSRQTDNAYFARLAEGQYLEAIRAMNSALQDPIVAKEDDTLLAVMVLTSFETMVNTETNTLVAWSNHVKGAAALLAARGPAQFQTVDGVRMFGQTMLPILISSMVQGASLSPMLKSLMQVGRDCVPSSNTAVRILDYVVQVSDFYGSVKQKNMVDPALIVQQAQELDEMAIDLMSDFDGVWQHQTVHVDEPSDVVPLGYYYVYTNFVCAEKCNGIRALRVLLNQMIRSVLILGLATRPPIFLDKQYSVLLQQATDNLYMLQNEIIASIPQYLGYASPHANQNHGSLQAELQSDILRSPTSITTASHAPVSTPIFIWSNFPDNSCPSPSPSELSGPYSDETSSLPVIRAGGGAHIPWVLFVLGLTDIATQSTRTWALERLRTIGTDLSVRHALLLAEKLENGSYVEMEAWYRSLWEGVLIVGAAAEKDGEEFVL